MASDNHNVTNQWPKLENPPVVVAICQIKFDESNVILQDFLRFDAYLRRFLPERNNNIAASISLKNNTPIPLGKAPVNGVSDAKVASYLYFSKVQKEKLDISTDGITYTSEAAYVGWDNFKATVLKYIELFKPILETIAIKRTSIRFVNQFEMVEFDDPAEYFNTVISSTDDDKHLPYPLLKYGFRMTVDVKEGVYSIINQNVDKITDKYIYIFDIDVLNRNNLLYTSESLGDVLEDLRNIKNNIFFNNITEKTRALCN